MESNGNYLWDDPRANIMQGGFRGYRVTMSGIFENNMK